MNWFKQRRLRKQSATFWQLLQQGNAAGALDLYDANLAADKAELNRELRAAYHLTRWLAGRKAEDAEALRLLTAGAPAGSQLAAAWQTFQRLQRESSLAQALRKCDPVLVGDPAPA